MTVERYREQRALQVERLEEAGHTPEVVAGRGGVVATFGAPLDYVWCTQCGFRDAGQLSPYPESIPTYDRCPAARPTGD